MKVGDLVRHNGGGGESPAIGIIIREYPEYGYWKVLDLCGQSIGCTADADGTPRARRYGHSRMPVT